MKNREAGFEKNEQLSECLERARAYRFEDIDELPPEKVSPENPDYQRYKCRTNWWQGLLSLLKSSRRANYIPDKEAQKSVDDFIAYAKTIDYAQFRTKGEIDAANNILDTLIDQLEKA